MTPVVPAVSSVRVVAAGIEAVAAASLGDLYGDLVRAAAFHAACRGGKGWIA